MCLFVAHHILSLVPEANPEGRARDADVVMGWGGMAAGVPTILPHSELTVRGAFA